MKNNHRELAVIALVMGTATSYLYLNLHTFPQELYTAAYISATTCYYTTVIAAITSYGHYQRHHENKHL